jgi:GGDEF domain-containing protein
MPSEKHDRHYFQSRLREELDRARRYQREFSLLMFEAVPASDGIPIGRKVEGALEAIAPHLRGSDVVARVFDDTVVALLVETNEQGAHDAMFRIRNRLAAQTGRWQVTTYYFPRDKADIENSLLLNAA